MTAKNSFVLKMKKFLLLILVSGIFLNGVLADDEANDEEEEEPKEEEEEPSSPAMIKIGEP